MKKPVKPIRVEGNLAYISLRKGYEAIIDAADADLASQQHWYALVKRRKTGLASIYATSSVWENGAQKTVALHRLIMNAGEGFHVDHINGDGLDNRRSNLRIATSFENSWNSRLRHDSKAGMKGVSWDAHNKCWRGIVVHKGQRHSIGYFKCLNEAKTATEAKRRELHGVFARLA